MERVATKVVMEEGPGGSGEGVGVGAALGVGGALGYVCCLGSVDSALCGDCGRVRNCSGRCGPRSCSRDRQLKVDGGGFRGFGEVAEIFRVAVVSRELRRRRWGAARLRSWLRLLRFE